jgi:HD-GYP domain-containing protein (c-di-GMP phosphodiesterase class II)
MEAVAAQAAIALENAAMIKRILNQFEQFVLAAVEAVEERDPATSGHSYRVARIAVQIAQGLNDQDRSAGIPCRFSETAIKELEYAGLLHDFGKVYIDPSIFLKAKKLYPEDLEKLQLRLKYLRRSLEFDYARRRGDLDNDTVRLLDEERDRHIAELLEITKLIEHLNEPSITPEDPENSISRILNSPIPRSVGIDDETIPLLTEMEIANLRIRKGSLNDQERSEIERHVVRSYEFVKRIPWPREYEGIPLYVKTHHEMLNGTGYPDELKGDQIPLQGRILAVADVYDALTASDRPYKKAVPLEKALAILEDEAVRGRLDGNLVTLLRRIIREE